MRNIIELNSFSAVGPGQTANLVIEPGVTYDSIYIESALKADIEHITLKLNGEEILPRMTVAEIEAIQYRKGHRPVDQTNEYVELPLQLRDALYDGTQRVTGLVVGPGDNCVLDVKIKSSAVAPVLSAFSETRGFPGMRSVVRKFERLTVPSAAAGKVDFTSMQRGSRLLKVYFMAPFAINGLEIIRDSAKVWELSKDRARLIHGSYGADCDVDDTAGIKYVFDPVREGFPLKDAFSTQANALNFKIETGGAGNIEVLIERLEPFAANWSAKAAPVAKRKATGRR
ncbi:major capsid protein P2 [Reinekea sp.]|jgi:hypothetical protein|uniref:major capsid protein P2 n=1 Tax=Reinekea sp. TaxID=1970455 RepID=UPI00398A329B